MPEVRRQTSDLRPHKKIKVKNNELTNKAHSKISIEK